MPALELEVAKRTCILPMRVHITYRLTQAPSCLSRFRVGGGGGVKGGYVPSYYHAYKFIERFHVYPLFCYLPHFLDTLE